MRICEGWRLVALTWFNHIVACWSMVQHPHLCLWHFAGLLRLGPIGATWSMARSLQEKTSTRLGWQVKADRTLLAAQSGEKGLKKLAQGFWILEIYLTSCRKRRPCNPNKAWQDWHWKKGQKPAQALYQNKELVPAAAATAAPAARATGAEREMENWWTWGKHPPRQVTVWQNCSAYIIQHLGNQLVGRTEQIDLMTWTILLTQRPRISPIDQ